MRGTMDIQDQTITDIERQIRFELRCIEDGVRVAREALSEQGLGGSNVGSKMMKKIFKPLMEQVSAAQVEAHARLTGPNLRKPHLWWAPILTLTAEKVSVIILNTLFTANPREGSVNYRLSSLASDISRAIQTQIDYEMWVKDQRQLKKELKAEGITEFTDLERLLHSTKNVDHRAWAKFNERITRAKMDKWSKENGIAFGVKCIDLLISARPEWFSIKTNPVGRGMFEVQLTLTAEAQAVLLELLEQEEIATPRLLPTIIPPLPWRYIKPKETSDAETQQHPVHHQADPENSPVCG